MSAAITAFYAGLCGLLLLYLSYRITMLRRKYQVGIGDGGHEELARTVRVQANFVEYTPLCLLLLALLEWNGTSAWALHALGVSLTAGRILHAYGLSRNSEYSPGRFVGTLLTWTVLPVAASLAVLNIFGVRI